MASAVIILGAGATLSDVSTASLRKRPPLDRGFFEVAQRFEPTLTKTVADYMRNTYEADITSPEEDFLERVMAAIYTDVYNTSLEDDAMVAFRALLRLFTQRLIETTNGIAPTRKRFLYRVLVSFLKRGYRPEDVTIITFNQDLQAEKVLQHLAGQARWRAFADQLWRFPYSYNLGTPRPSVTSGGTRFFETAPSDGPNLALLKLHGSLNWYSPHTSQTPPRTAMFRPSRTLRITARIRPVPSLSLSGGRRRTYGLPVIIPPVSHKSAVLHERLRPVWELAEARLKAADEILVFGYSCPALDFESANLLRRSQRDQTPARRISVIDPNPAVVARYMELMTPCRLRYYPSASYFLTD